MNPTSLILTLASAPAGITTDDLARRLNSTREQALPVLERLQGAGAVVRRRGRGWRLTVSVAEAVSRYITAAAGTAA